MDFFETTDTLKHYFLFVSFHGNNYFLLKIHYVCHMTKEAIRPINMLVKQPSKFFSQRTDSMKHWRLQHIIKIMYNWSHIAYFTMFTAGVVFCNILSLL